MENLLRKIPGMPQLQVCSLTGADDATEIHELIGLGKEYSYVELGILWSKEREGTPRYPSKTWIKQLTARVSKLPFNENIRLALHVCGRPNIEELLSNTGEFPSLLDGFSRVQLNFIYNPGYMESIREFLKVIRSYGIKPIIQMNAANSGLIVQLGENQEQTDVLLDSSGGRGIEPLRWPSPTWQNFGYAGGIGPENIESVLTEIHPYVVNKRIWVDMESKLRREDPDVFCLDKCRTVLEAIHNFKGDSEYGRG